MRALALAGGTAAWIGTLAVTLWLPSYYGRPADDGRWFSIVGDSSMNGDALSNLVLASSVLGAFVLVLAGWRRHPIIRVALCLAGLLVGGLVVDWIAVHVHGFYDATV